MEQKLKNIYEDPSDPGSFGGVTRLLSSARHKGIKVNRNQVENFLKSNEPYTLHRPARRRFARNPTIVGGIDQQWQADLADMATLSKFNDGNRYLLTIIDCFSKYAWAIPVKTKDGISVAAGFRRALAERVPKKLQTDKGKEFFNKEFQTLLSKHKIQHFATENET